MSDELKIVYEPTPNTHYKTYYPKKNMTFGCHNLNEGEEIILTFSDLLSIENHKGKSGIDIEVTVAHFSNKHVPTMVLNLTNARIVESLHGKLCKDWIGKSIQVYGGKVRNPAGGSDIDGLKVREFVPNTGEDITEYEDKMNNAATEEELKEAYFNAPKHIQPRLNNLANTRRAELS